jgi:hypothetical protein
MPSPRLSSLRGAAEEIVETEKAMHNTSKLKPSRKRTAVRDLTTRNAVKGGIIIDWKPASTASRPGEERGVIAIIKPATGA